MALSVHGLKKKVFWIYFDLKSISKNKNQNIGIHFLISNQRMNFKNFFHFSILVMKLKHEKWKIFKIRFLFKSKNKLYFRYADSVHVLHPRIFELKPKLKVNFKFKFKLKFKFKFKFKLKFKFKFSFNFKVKLQRRFTFKFKVKLDLQFNFKLKFKLQV